MRKPITQKDGMGCGAACLAFILNCSYRKALRLLRSSGEAANTRGFFCRDLVAALQRAGLTYQYQYIKANKRNQIYKNGMIVFIKRSKRYPVGHYLCRYQNQWIDLWVNFPKDQNIKNAKAGFRKRLPGRPIYAIQEVS